MGFFKGRERSQPPPTPFREPTASKRCLCGATIPASDLPDHLDTHIFAVTTAAGHPGRSFDCPLCGPSDLAYGQAGEHPISLRNMSRAFFRKHCREAHGTDL